MPEISGFAQWLRRPSKRKYHGPASKRKRLSFLQHEALESRSMMAGDTFTLNFNVPQDVATLGVWASINGKLTQPYNSLPTDTYVYYDNGTSDLAAATTNTDLSFQLTITSGVASLEIPNTPITSGQVVIGVGSAPTFSYNGAGISSPTAKDQSYFGLFEFTLDGTATGDANNYLDIDLSEVDQVGVPFYVTTEDSAPPYPGEDGFGITMQRDTLFNNYQTYIADKANGVFGETYSQGNLNGTQWRIVAPKDLNLGNAQVQFPTNAVTFGIPGGNLVLNQQYYWFVTATSAAGESEPSAGVGNMTSTSGQQTATITWDPYVGATGYNVYRATSNDPSAAVLVGQPSGYATISFNDNGGQINSNAPPSNGYTFSALNAYYNDAIDAFFDYYTNNTFELYYAGDNTVFTGGVVPYTDNSGNTYTVLQVSPLSSPSDTYNIYKPFFSNNMDPTEFPGLPPAPSWMPHADQSPADMIFSADGVFNSGDPSAANAGYQSDLGNAIASAFNRGLADQTSISPSNWASNPALYSVAATTGTLPANQAYYYVITAETGYDDGTNSYTFGESVISLERMLPESSSTQGAILTWQQINPAGVGGVTFGYTDYHIYRSTTQGSGYTRIHTISNESGTPATTWTDSGSPDGTIAPPVFYAEGSTSNWYSAYWHLNSTNDPTNGVSINGLAYGYPYDDQGGFSTNIQWVSASDGSGVPETVTIHLDAWGNTPNPPHPHPHPHPNPSTDAFKIIFLEQPVAVKKGKDTTIQFQVLTSTGQAFQGGGTVNIKIDGMEKGSYAVEIDETTGIGTLTFKNKKLGVNMIKASFNDEENGEIVAYSDVYQVVSKDMPKKAMKEINKADKYLDTKAFKNVLKKLARR
jgi:hypothetical protein